MELLLQTLIVLTVVVVAVWPLLKWGRLRIELVTLPLLIVAGLGWWIYEPQPSHVMLEAAEVDAQGGTRRRRLFKPQWLPQQVTGQEYVSSQACRSCHPGQFSTWHRTFHRTMTQVATPEAVVPDHSGQFDGVVLQSRGRRYELARRGDEFWVKMVDPDWDRERQARGLPPEERETAPVVERKIVMTTGSHHQQTYWVPSRWGRELFQFPWEFHIREKLWFPTEDAELRPSSTERYSGHWNVSCIHCHSVAPNPGFLESGSTRGRSGTAAAAFVIPGIGRSSTDTLRTETAALYSEVVELGISCEACHGPAAAHVAYHRNPARRLVSHLDNAVDPTIVNPGRLDHVRSSQVCGRCHALKMPHQKEKLLRERDPYRPGEDLGNHYRVVGFDDPVHKEMTREGSHLYWNDGSCRLGGREFLGQVVSACYTRGKMSCLSCHAMHESDPNDQLADGMQGNTACLQCHESFRRDIPAHTHHKADSVGSRCYNCHMPHTSYALFTAIRIHRIASPVVKPITHATQPNACNLCHLDRSLAWTSEKLSKWYGRPDIKLNVEERTMAAGVLWMLRGDAAQRAIAAWHAGWPPAVQTAGTAWQTPLLARLLGDSYSAIRFIAWQSLKALPGTGDLKYNFVAPEAERARVAGEVTRAWRADDRTTAGPLPRKSDGSLDWEWLEELWERRDRRTVEIPE